MKQILVIALLAATAYGLVVAKWTGRSEQFTSVTGRQAIRCEYELIDRRTFWRTFTGLNCPIYIEIY